jgi:hypothetical protein
MKTHAPWMEDLKDINSFSKESKCQQRQWRGMMMIASLYLLRWNDSFGGSFQFSSACLCLPDDDKKVYYTRHDFA